MSRQVLCSSVAHIFKMNYTNSEMCDMHFVYCRTNGNLLTAMRLYEEMYPNRVIPHHTMFARLHQRFREAGSFKKLTNGNGRPRTVSTPDAEEQVLQELEDIPTTSTRKIAATLHVSYSTVFKVLRNQLLYPYHIPVSYTHLRAHETPEHL